MKEKNPFYTRLSESLSLLLSDFLKSEITVSFKEEKALDEVSAENVFAEKHVCKAVIEDVQMEILLGFDSSWNSIIATGAQGLTEISIRIQEALIVLLSRLEFEIQPLEFVEFQPSSSKSLLTLQDYVLLSWDVNSEKGSANFIIAFSEIPKEMARNYSEVWQKLTSIEPEEWKLYVKDALEESSAKLGIKGVSYIKDQQAMEVEFEAFDKKNLAHTMREVRNFDLLKDVEMEITVELGKRKIPLGRVLQLVKGSVLELDKLAGEPVDVMVNGQAIAQGDVIVMDEHFGVRISKLLSTAETAKLGEN